MELYYPWISGPLRVSWKKDFDFVFETVFENAGAKLWKSAGERLL